MRKEKKEGEGAYQDPHGLPDLGGEEERFRGGDWVAIWERAELQEEEEPRKGSEDRGEE